MKVLQVTNARSPFFENQLSALESVDVSVDVSAPNSGTDGDRDVFDYLRYYPELLRTARSDFDLIHVNYGLLGPLGLAQPTRPVVLTLWGSDVMGQYPLVNTLTELAVARADAVIAPSRALATSLDTSPWIVPFGIDTDTFRPIPRDTARERVGWPKDETIALFPYDPDRGVKNYPLAERVIEAVPESVTLRTIDGVPYPEMPYYFNASDLVLVTSKRESGPMVVKEAAACNVPVVSTDVGFAEATLEHVEHSAVASTEADLVEVVSTVLAGSGRSNGRTAPNLISIETMGDRLEEVYSAVIAERSG